MLLLLLILIFSYTGTFTTWETFNVLSLGFQWSEAPWIGLSPDSGSLPIYQNSCQIKSRFSFTDMTGDPHLHPDGTPSCWQRGLWGNQPRRSGGGRTSVLASWKLIRSAFQKGGRFLDKLYVCIFSCKRLGIYLLPTCVGRRGFAGRLGAERRWREPRPMLSKLTLSSGFLSSWMQVLEFLKQGCQGSFVGFEISTMAN